MTVKDLKELIKNKPDNTKVLLVGWDKDKGENIKQDTHPCCNFEHQDKVNEVWLSLEGFRVKT